MSIGWWKAFPIIDKWMKEVMLINIFKKKHIRLEIFMLFFSLQSLVTIIGFLSFF